MSIAAQLILNGQVGAVGVVAPELAFDPKVVFAELKNRQIVIHIDKQSVDPLAGYLPTAPSQIFKLSDLALSRKRSRCFIP